ncbi:hypothetical protein CHS0354_030903, partial [Potamilus streckersoni]
MTVVFELTMLVRVDEVPAKELTMKFTMTALVLALETVKLMMELATELFGRRPYSRVKCVCLDGGRTA